jgi:OOP family OmpA-OmpF porin
MSLDWIPGWLRASAILAIAVVPVAAFGQAQDVAGSQDHPLVSRFPGSVIMKYRSADFDRFEMPLGKATAKDEFTEVRPVEGKMTWIAYRIPRERSTVEVERSYAEALRKAGFEILYECHTERECGNWFSYAFTHGVDPTEVYAGEVPDEAGEHYFAARRDGPSGETYVVVYAYPAVLKDFHIARVRVVEVGSMAEDLVTVNAAAMAKGIEEAGHIALYGLRFATDSAEIAPESEATLAEMATFLRENPETSVYVVGHTDDTGALSHNMDLSQRRAEAVARALVSRYEIAAARVVARGVGPLAPVVSNDTEDGRARNRRVELVEQ